MGDAPLEIKLRHIRNCHKSRSQIRGRSGQSLLHSHGRRAEGHLSPQTHVWQTTPSQRSPPRKLSGAGFSDHWWQPGPGIGIAGNHFAVVTHHSFAVIGSRLLWQELGKALPLDAPQCPVWRVSASLPGPGRHPGAGQAVYPGPPLGRYPQLRAAVHPRQTLAVRIMLLLVAVGVSIHVLTIKTFRGKN